MSGPDSGKYWIKLSTDTKVLASVDAFAAPIIPVVANGPVNVFDVQRFAGGRYTLVLERDGVTRHVRPDDKDVVGDTAQIQYPWNISGSDGGPYKIETSGLRPHQFWTVKDPWPGHPLTLEFSGASGEQEWKFAPWPGPK